MVAASSSTPPPFSSATISRVLLSSHADRLQPLSYRLLQEVTGRVVAAFNARNPGSPYTLPSGEAPRWDPARNHNFFVIVYQQVKADPIRAATDSLYGRVTVTPPTSVRAHLIFFSRFVPQNGHFIEESYAVFSGSAYNVIRDIADAHFTEEAARKLFGERCFVTELQKLYQSGSEVSKGKGKEKSYRKLRKHIITKQKATIRENCPLLQTLLFQNRTRPVHIEVVNTENQRAVKIKHPFYLESFPQLFVDLEQLPIPPLSKEAGMRNTWRQVPSPVTQERDRFLMHRLWEAFRTDQWAEIDHPLYVYLYDSFIEASRVILHYNEHLICDLPKEATLRDVFRAFSEIPPDTALSALFVQAKVDERVFLEQIPSVLITLQKDKSSKSKQVTARVFDFMQGDENFEGVQYIRREKIWYENPSDFMLVFQSDFSKMLATCLQREGGPRRICDEIWERGISEFTYNQKYLRRAGFISGDHFMTQSSVMKMEPFDLIYIGAQETYIIHVKKGFGNTRTTTQLSAFVEQLAENRDSILKQYAEKITSFGTGEREELSYNLEIRAAWQQIADQNNTDILGALKRVFSRKIVFVYAFADSATTERSLEEELNPRPLREVELQSYLTGTIDPIFPAETARELFAQLQRDGWIDEEGLPTEKLLPISSQDKFFEEFRGRACKLPTAGTRNAIRSLFSSDQVTLASVEDKLLDSDKSDNLGQVNAQRIIQFMRDRGWINPNNQRIVELDEETFNAQFRPLLLKPLIKASTGPIYNRLKRVCSVFNMFMAKQRLLDLREQISDTKFSFEICQITTGEPS